MIKRFVLGFNDDSTFFTTLVYTVTFNNLKKVV